jgi:hypothetical protein
MSSQRGRRWAGLGEYTLSEAVYKQNREPVAWIVFSVTVLNALLELSSSGMSVP